MRCQDFKSWLPERLERLRLSGRGRSCRGGRSGRSCRNAWSGRVGWCGGSAVGEAWWEVVAQQMEMFAFAEVVEQEGCPFRWRDCGCDYGLETLISQYVSGC